MVISPAGRRVDQARIAVMPTPIRSANSNAAAIAAPLLWASSTPRTIFCPVGAIRSPRQATTGQGECGASLSVGDPTSSAVSSDTSSLPSTTRRAWRLTSASGAFTELETRVVVTGKAVKSARTASSAACRMGWHDLCNLANSSAESAPATAADRWARTSSAYTMWSGAAYLSATVAAHRAARTAVYVPSTPTTTGPTVSDISSLPFPAPWGGRCYRKRIVFRTIRSLGRSGR